ncbi:Lysophospholipid acyltransferase [Coemansia brasiliensis]|uniref:Lysophospholipid acyltransferase n=1 Tax=Coemansia brasiliensis TaxID=2650707 RepID=A0A9W8IEQ9_9FUNG|nr:Lysophospholipid acyltransferase [Coemansia brasiliensis]
MRVLDRGLAWLSHRYLGDIPVDRISTVVAVLLSYALAHVFRRIPPRMASVKHAYSVVSTLLLFGAVQGQYAGLIHLAVGSAIAYGLIRLVRIRYMPYAVFLAAMLHMSYSHIRRQLNEQRSGRVELDYTGAQMVFVIKVTSLAFCIYDGQQAEKELSGYQRKNAISQVPSPLEFFGYVFFFPGFAVGPAFELATYRRMVQLDDAKAARQLARRGYRKLLEGLFWMAVYIAYSSTYSFAEMARREFYLQRSFGSTALYLCATGVVVRAAYYTAWKMSEGACIVAGLGFDGYDEAGKAQWLDIANVHVRGVEMGTSLRQLIDSWNIGTNTWLRHHVYLRIARKPSGSAHAASTRATVLTFLVSAWWHGFYPGYYLTFILAALSANAARVLRRNLHGLVALHADAGTARMLVKFGYDMLGWALSKYTLDFVAAPFMVLTLQSSLEIWRGNCYAVVLGVLGIYILFRGLDVGHLLRDMVGERAHPTAKKNP